MNVVLPVLLSSLSKETAKQLLISYGPLVLTGIQALSGVQTDRRNRQAAVAQIQNSEAQRKAAEKLEAELDKLIDKIQPKEVRIIENAFNSASGYRDAFMAAAVVTILFNVAEGVKELRNIGIQLEGIKEELDRQTLAKVGGWEDGFGKFVHKFVQTEIAIRQSSGRKHAFYVYNPDTIWVPEFEILQQNQPLGPSFGGYSSDLQAIFLLMWTNRKTLTEKKKVGTDVVFHLLVPSAYFGAISQLFVIHPEIGPLVIRGHLYKGKTLFWFNFKAVPEEVTLQDVGNIDDLEEPTPMCGKICMGSWTVAGAALLIGAVFPPLAPIATTVAMGGVYGFGGGVCLSILDTMTYDSNFPILGPPLFQSPGNGN
jgi:transcription antitermination factor NusA-like protein